MRDKAFRRHQEKRKLRKYMGYMNYYSPHLSIEMRLKQAHKMERCGTGKICSCFLCSVSTKRDGYKHSDQQKINNLNASLKEIFN